MTKQEAEENITMMEAHTPRPAMKKLIQIALGPLGKLSDEAKAVYAAKLGEL